MEGLRREVRTLRNRVAGLEVRRQASERVEDGLRGEITALRYGAGALRREAEALQIWVRVLAVSVGMLALLGGLALRFVGGRSRGLRRRLAALAATRREGIRERVAAVETALHLLRETAHRDDPAAEPPREG